MKVQLCSKNKHMTETTGTSHRQKSRLGTYECHPRVKHLHAVSNVAKLKGGQISTIILINFVVDDHDETASEVGADHESKSDQCLLINAGPWRVRDSQEDRLLTVNIVKGVLWEPLHDPSSCGPLEAKQLKKTFSTSNW